jgi:hypothetical protein
MLERMTLMYRANCCMDSIAAGTKSFKPALRFTYMGFSHESGYFSMQCNSETQYGAKAPLCAPYSIIPLSSASGG